MGAKAALYLAMNEAGISKMELARRLQVDEKEVRRLLDPHHPPKLPRMEEALHLLGKRLVLSLQPGVELVSEAVSGGGNKTRTAKAPTGRAKKGVHLITRKRLPTAA